MAPRPTRKFEDHPLSVVRDCLFSICSQLRSSLGAVRVGKYLADRITLRNGLKPGDVLLP